MTKLAKQAQPIIDFTDSFNSILRVALRYVEHELDAKGVSTLGSIIPRVLEDKALRRWRDVLSDNRLRCVISTCVRLGAWNSANIVLRNGIGFTRRTLQLVKR